MARTRRDSDLSLIPPHRDGGSSSSTVRGRIPDADAPTNDHHEDYSGTVLAAGFRSAEPGSEAERALIAAVDLLAANARTAAAASAAGGGRGGGGDDVITRAFVRRAVALFLGAMTVVWPATDKLAERVLSPSSALERKLDDMITTQASLQQQTATDHATFVALAKWVVSCEIARRNGQPMPEPPAAVRMILVQDELARSTGP